VSSSDRTVKRQQIEDSTAARLAEIVAAAEQAARQVIDEAEAEARERLSDAHEEADRIVEERLAAVAALTDEISAQAEALRRGAEALQAALARARMEVGGPEADGPRPIGPSLTVVGAPLPDSRPVPEPEPVPDRDLGAPRASEPEPEPAMKGDAEPVTPQNFDAEPPASIGTPAGARLLATQMAVSGSSREEIETRLRVGFAIDDTRPILDAILGPEK
jgi:hypothetical protein